MAPGYGRHVARPAGETAAVLIDRAAQPDTAKAPRSAVLPAAAEGRDAGALGISWIFDLVAQQLGLRPALFGGGEFACFSGRAASATKRARKRARRRREIERSLAEDTWMLSSYW
jgi:hypothetical protein